MYALMEKVTKALEKDPTADLIKHFERENELARQHKIALFSMIFGQQPPNTSQVTQKVNQGQANNTYSRKISNSQSCQPKAKIMQQQHLNQTVVCSDGQLPRSQANIRQQHSNPASLTTDRLQHGNFIHQHPNPTSMPMNQFHQSQASVSTQQHSYPASIPNNQLQQSTASTVQQQHSNQIRTPYDQTTTGHDQIHQASSDPSVLPQYSNFLNTKFHVQQTTARSVLHDTQQENAQATENEPIYENLF